MKTIDDTGVTDDRNGEAVLLAANPNGKVIGLAMPSDGRELRTFHLSSEAQQRLRAFAEKAQS